MEVFWEDFYFVVWFIELIVVLDLKRGGVGYYYSMKLVGLYDLR